MADYLTTDTELTDVADAIREKGGTSAALEWPDGYVDAIGDIESISDVPQRSSSDLTASGATVTVPSGYYPSSASKSVASGTAGTPYAIKTIVSGHYAQISPKVTNSAGYINGGAINGTSFNVSASEIVSGTLSITSDGTYDVTSYASANVSVGGGGGAWQDVSSHFTYYDGTSTVEITALKNGDMVILLLTVTAVEDYVDGFVVVDQGYGPAEWFVSTSGTYSLVLYYYIPDDGYVIGDFAAWDYVNNLFDLNTSSPVSVTGDNDYVYFIGVYSVN